ncbi:DUF736 domain-containing protein [Shewanella mangrovisoli]|uniref:DUF736 domain-containing protein n=1 Tax=Shewanella mangrovisoli TaxID=2864211 RepID=UPI003CCAA66E
MCHPQRWQLVVHYVTKAKPQTHSLVLPWSVQATLQGGQLHTLALNLKVKLVPNDKGNNESAPDFRVQAASYDIGAAWKKISEAGREYLSVTIDDLSFPGGLPARY